MHYLYVTYIHISILNLRTTTVYTWKPNKNGMASKRDQVSISRIRLSTIISSARVLSDLQISLDCLVSENVIRWMPASGIVTNFGLYHNNASAKLYGYVFPLWCYQKPGIKDVAYWFESLWYRIALFLENSPCWIGLCFETFHISTRRLPHE